MTCINYCHQMKLEFYRAVEDTYFAYPCLRIMSSCVHSRAPAISCCIAVLFLVRAGLGVHSGPETAVTHRLACRPVALTLFALGCAGDVVRCCVQSACFLYDFICIEDAALLCPGGRDDSKLQHIFT